MSKIMTVLILVMRHVFIECLVAKATAAKAGPSAYVSSYILQSYIVLHDLFDLMTWSVAFISAKHLEWPPLGLLTWSNDFRALHDSGQESRLGIRILLITG